MRTTVKHALHASTRIFSPLADTLLRLVYLPKLTTWKQSAPVLLDRGQPYNYARRTDLYSQLLATELLRDTPIDYLEFGVHRGASFKWWADHNTHPDSRFYGFDTFSGLPEHWKGDREKGHFDTKGQIPLLPDNRCAFHAGLFQQTLYPVLDRVPLTRKLVIHCDADLYSSTLFVLTALAPSMKPGDLLLFDEFTDSIHEFRALTDFQSAFPVRFTPLAAVNDYRQTAFRVEQGLGARIPARAAVAV